MLQVQMWLVRAQNRPTPYKGQTPAFAEAEAVVRNDVALKINTG
ncbi:MAG: hypothetical protein AAF484_14750 [Pseudomonadota bacterium]